MNLVSELWLLVEEDERDARDSLITHEPGEPWGYSGVPGDGPHLARWSPERVLRECEAKRLVVEWLIQQPDPEIRERLLRTMLRAYQ